MSDVMTVRCGTCGERAKVAAKHIGRRARCKGCSGTFELRPEPPAVPSWEEPEGDPFADMSQFPPEREDLPPPPPKTPALVREAPPRPPHRAMASPATKGKREPARKAESRRGGTPYKVGLILVIVVCGAISAYLRSNAKRLGNEMAGAPDYHRQAQPVVQAPPPPPRVFGAAPTLMFVTEGDRSIGTATVTGRNANRTNVRLVLPAGKAADRALPCVFVCPAGSNLLVGVPFGDGEHEDFYPLLERGIAVCFYSLDGTVEQLQSPSDLRMAWAITEYGRSECGLRNLADAIDTVLASTRSVDPARLATCGHSSAGTIAVMGLAREPRIAAAAAMAPALDIPKRIGRDVIDGLPGGVARLVYANSPSQVERLDKPLFIYHARDDANVPAADSEAFVNRHPARVKLQLAPTGGHGGAYDAGRPVAFDFLAAALRAPPQSASLTGARPAAAPRGSGPARNVPSGALPFAGHTELIGRQKLVSSASPKDFVVVGRSGVTEILRAGNGDDALASPRVRIHNLSGPGACIRSSSRAQGDGHADGEIRVDVAAKQLCIVSPQTVPFAARGTAQRTGSADQEAGRATKEVLYTMAFSGGVVAVHAIAPPDDQEGMQQLEEIIRSFELK